jgi:hypothetical protein
MAFYVKAIFLSNFSELFKPVALFFVQLQRLARCEKDDFPLKAKAPLEENPYFLRELNEPVALFFSL